MTIEELKIAADKHMARAHGYKLAGEHRIAMAHSEIAYHLISARKLMLAVA